MTENRRDKILPEDLIQRTNLQQHNFMIDAINDIDGRQGDIERITNVNIDDIVDLKTDVVALSNDKLDKADIDEDIHFGPITITKDGTAVIASFDAINPTTGTVTPLSFLLPGATTTDAGVMDASSVAWITEAEVRISALEGLSDVKAIVGLDATPTQAEINGAWMDEVGKAPETGDLAQDVSNAKLWVYVTDTWILYGTLVVVPLATTTALGGIRDTALDAPANRWYGHVEADGRLSLIGGDSLSTLLDTTVPGLQTGVNGKVSKTGNEDIAGIKTFLNTMGIFKRVTFNLENNNQAWFDSYSLSDTRVVTRLRMSRMVGGTPTETSVMSFITDGDEVYSTVGMRSSPEAMDIVNKGYLDTRLTAKQDTITGGASTIATTNLTGSRALVSDSSGKVAASTVTSTQLGYVSGVTSAIQTQLNGKQAKLTFDSTPTASSTNPVTSGGVKTALDAKADVPTWTYGSGTLTTNAGTCGYNYAHTTIGDVVIMRFTVGPSVDNTFNVPLPVSVASASVQCMGISDNASFWVDYGGTATSSISVNRTQGTPAERSFHLLVIGQPSN